MNKDECVYVGNTHGVTRLGTMTLTVVVITLSGCIYVCVVSQKAIKLFQTDESSG